MSDFVRYLLEEVNPRLIGNGFEPFTRQEAEAQERNFRLLDAAGRL